jgi:hypothetical protein
MITSFTILHSGESKPRIDTKNMIEALRLLRLRGIILNINYTTKMKSWSGMSWLNANTRSARCLCQFLPTMP